MNLTALKGVWTMRPRSHVPACDHSSLVCCIATTKKGIRLAPVSNGWSGVDVDKRAKSSLEKTLKRAFELIPATSHFRIPMHRDFARSAIGSVLLDRVILLIT